MRVSPGAQRRKRVARVAFQQKYRKYAKVVFCNIWACENPKWTAFAGVVWKPSMDCSGTGGNGKSDWRLTELVGELFDWCLDVRIKRSLCPMLSLEHAAENTSYSTVGLIFPGKFVGTCSDTFG
jgi:hypothetical protein